MPSRSLIRTLLLLALFCAPPTHAQQTTSTLKVYSRETIVDVTVTDPKGNPVHGLTRDDFTVKEDNKPQPIRSFEEFGSKPITALAKLPPNVYTNLQPPPPAAPSTSSCSTASIPRRPTPPTPHK
jgi:hypothetical protein